MLPTAGSDPLTRASKSDQQRRKLSLMLHNKVSSKGCRPSPAAVISIASSNALLPCKEKKRKKKKRKEKRKMEARTELVNGQQVEWTRPEATRPHQSIEAKLTGQTQS